MKEYVQTSLETHLFFARIMKEHAFFLQVGFMQRDEKWIEKSRYYYQEFESLLKDTVKVSNRMISNQVLCSGELVTEFTAKAEEKTSCLSGVSFDCELTAAEKALEGGNNFHLTREMLYFIFRLNERAVCLLKGFIAFKEQLLCEVKSCNIFTGNYPLLIEHMTREAKLYCEMLECMQRNQRVCFQSVQNQELFWNRAMMEHAWFIRGLLDPCETELICMADGFANEFQQLLDQAKEQCSLETTMQLRDFKAKGTCGLLEGCIQGIILPLLADHVLREANYYIRLLEHR